MGYYGLIKLGKKDFAISKDHIVVSLDQIGAYDIIDDDVKFNASLNQEGLYWISGGGTYIINHRYLIVVKRPETSRVNAGFFSIFTGRSDGYDEWINPMLVVRELFEELILCDNN